jgi:hypothetical protein
MKPAPPVTRTRFAKLPGPRGSASTAADIAQLGSAQHRKAPGVTTREKYHHDLLRHSLSAPPPPSQYTLRETRLQLPDSGRRSRFLPAHWGAERGGVERGPRSTAQAQMPWPMPAARAVESGTFYRQGSPAWVRRCLDTQKFSIMNE